MAQNKDTDVKSPAAAREERVLGYWRDNDTFAKTLKKNEGKKEFVFYEGPPTANGKPGIHHLEARAFKDAIPRYKTMQGYYVRRKGGWDTHGLPVELQVEKELGFKSKKDIEQYGIAAFNKKCKESVWQYIDLWTKFTDRIGYWVDQKDPYVTYDPRYIESLWGIIKKVHGDELLYKDYKVVPWCPRCGTGLSSHELAQGYETVKDLSVTVALELVDEPKTFFLAWTTTPWTLPGNVALAVGADIDYMIAEVETGEKYIFASARAPQIMKDAKFTDKIKEIKGKDLVGKSYKPLYPFLKDNLPKSEQEKLTNAFKVYPAEFVTTEDGTGIVHTAVMYGADDFELGTKVGLPKHHLVRDDGTFKDETGFLSGKFVKDENVAVDIVKDLAGRGLLFKKEKYEHTYPHCWRCKTPLIYFARDSWYIKMSSLRDKLVRENETINWEPAHIKEGRFGEWLREIKDWAISRERFWGTPLPIWSCGKCGSREVLGSYDELKEKISTRNTYLVMRHGEAIHNTKNILSCKADAPHHLTEKGREEARLAGEKLKREKIDLIISSPFVRTKETAEIVASLIGYPKEKIVIDKRIQEINAGVYDGRSIVDYHKEFPTEASYFTKTLDGGENFTDIKKRVGDFIYDIDKKYEGKTILVVSHDTPTWLLFGAAYGETLRELLVTPVADDFLAHAEIKPLSFKQLPHNDVYEFDPHRPYIDEVKWKCSCGGEMKRASEVIDVWFDSGAMPFAQDHDLSTKRYPADFISEAIDQTRGWFYTLHAVGILMGRGKAFENVICLGHILDEKGKKMSKSLGNIVDPWTQIEKFGADAIRFWMYSVNQPGDSKNYDEKTVDEIVKKVFNPLSNIETLYSTYKNDVAHGNVDPRASTHVLDTWILALRDELVSTMTKKLDAYNLFDPCRALRDFIAEFSQWYIRRSRERFKGDDTEDKKYALAVTRSILVDCARLMAPFTPFFAEDLFQKVSGSATSVHLESWPTVVSEFSLGKLAARLLGKGDEREEILREMQIVRDFISKGLEKRSKEAIKVRQPLALVTLPGEDTHRILENPDYLNLIKDELNVKGVVFDHDAAEVSLDMMITPELKAEGDYREFVRAVQELRKTENLVPADRVTLLVQTDENGKKLIEQFRSELQKVAGLSAIEYTTSEKSQEVKIDTLVFGISLKK